MMKKYTLQHNDNKFTSTHKRNTLQQTYRNIYPTEIGILVEEVLLNSNKNDCCNGF